MVAPTSTISHRAFGKRGKWCGGPVYQLLLVPSILRFTDCFGNSVWCKHCGLSSTCPYLPPDPDMDGKCFLKSSLLEQGFVMHLGHNGNPASPEESLG